MGKDAYLAKKEFALRLHNFLLSEEVAIAQGDFIGDSWGASILEILALGKLEAAAQSARIRHTQSATDPDHLMPGKPDEKAAKPLCAICRIESIGKCDCPDYMACWYCAPKLFVRPHCSCNPF